MKIENPHSSSTSFSHAEWAHSNLENFRQSEDARHHSEEVRNRALRLVEDRDRRTVRSQDDATNRLNERTRDVNTWKRELQRELDLLKREDQLLAEASRQLEHAIQQSKRPEEVVHICKTAREYRVGIDQVKDNVEIALDTEARELKRVHEGMRQHQELAVAQITSNEMIMMALKQDLQRKSTAIEIDTTCFELNTNSHEIAIHPGINQADITKSSPQSWVKYSDKNIEDSTNARKAAFKTNRNLKERILETEESQHLLQNHLELTLSEISELDKHIQILKESLRAKEPPLKLAETRLEFRTHRPDIEACNDSPHGK
ncbi:tektin-3 [Eurytemora carolleeae]|uniref:tektin-3 n=1 Tax=Eurytemora carolleeae TaxID=1294199 RepID=UPI000C78FCB2|nr:tektin-3 [Eurytemora carolleeae]|eukprot:XP_023348571.1 tektin-3-like [Eurytemora affinis]